MDPAKPSQKIRKGFKKSKMIDSTVNPEWGLHSVSLDPVKQISVGGASGVNAYSDGGVDRVYNVRVEVFDYDAFCPSDDFMGQVTLVLDYTRNSNGDGDGADRYGGDGVVGDSGTTMRGGGSGRGSYSHNNNRRRADYSIPPNRTVHRWMPLKNRPNTPKWQRDSRIKGEHKFCLHM